MTAGTTSEYLSCMDSTAIKALRKRYGLTQEEMAWECNVSISSIRAWEQGARAPGGAAVRVLQHMAEGVRVNPALRLPRRENLPTVATVAGVKVMIHYADHAPPHVHLSKGDMDIVVPISAPRLPSWAFSRADRRAVLAWMKDRRAKLLAAWERVCAGESPGSIP